MQKCNANPERGNRALGSFVNMRSYDSNQIVLLSHTIHFGISNTSLSNIEIPTNVYRNFLFRRVALTYIIVLN